MASRRVSLRYLITAAALSLGAAGATFHLKYAVRELEHELAGVRADIVRESWAAQAAQADLEYLTRPDRLAMQAAQLGLRPARGTNLARVEAIPRAQDQARAGLVLTATLPSGAEVPWRPRPMVVSAAYSGEKRP
jgi:hypothetical protein